MMFDTDELDLPGDHEQELPPTNVLHVHVYDLPPETEAPPIVESAPPAPDQPEQERTNRPEEDRPVPPQRQRWNSGLWYGILGFLLIGGALALVSFRSVLVPAPEATITIITVSTPIRATDTLTVVTGQPAKGPQISGRPLAAITMSQQTTIATTGTVHQDAQAARGLVTFYNVATYSQVVSAGTILIGADGVQIVTEQDAILPAVRYPTLGETTVSAHALIAGPAGDIIAGDIYGLCCRLSVSAVSSAFSRGENARSYPTVTPQDISTAATSLSRTVMQSAQTALQTQVSHEETLITPLPCQQRITSSQQPGSEAMQVTITASETCTGTVYNTQQYQNQLMHTMNQQAAKQLGQGYVLTGAIQSSMSTTSQHQKSIALHVTCAATYAYQMSQEQEQALARLVAGKSTTQATDLLLHQPWVQTVA